MHFDAEQGNQTKTFESNINSSDKSKSSENNELTKGLEDNNNEKQKIKLRQKVSIRSTTEKIDVAQFYKKLYSGDEQQNGQFPLFLKALSNLASSAEKEAERHKKIKASYIRS